ncbi:MAG: LytTR family transcriptional regulator DNA-binding domain-containing protein [Rikenellaceae bacterium]|nr:LytTR family transcriptional regulator DNA-binding domain-containing protein [Rikenellaceae bacterium]
MSEKLYQMKLNEQPALADMKLCPEGCHVNDGFFVFQENFYRKIYFEDIRWLEAAGSYCYIYLKNNRRIIVVHPLSEVEKKLPRKYFLRIHRSFMVNIHFVDAFIGNTLCIGPVRLLVSAPFRALVFSCFDVLGRNRSIRSLKPDSGKDNAGEK